MSYEKTGLGWSEMSAWESGGASCTTVGSTLPLIDWIRGEGETPENSREICFPTSEEHIARANSCVESKTRWTGDRIECTDDQGRSGHVWCCRPGYPRPYYEPSVVTPPGAEPETPPLPPIPTEFQPPTGERATFFEKLLHPGALLAIGLFAGAGVLIYYNWRS